MSSPRWLIGLVAIWVLLTIISNVVENVEIMTTGQVGELEAMTAQSLVESQDPDTGGVMASGMTPVGALEAIWKALTADYTFWYNVHYDMTEVQCDTANGRWHSSISACQIPNDFMIIRYIFFWPLTVALIIELALILRRIIAG